MDPSTECRNTGPGGGGENQEIPPTEDLMREHGLLNRLLLVYDEGIRRIRWGEELPPETLHHAARIIRDFIEDYHEHLEEQWVFPRSVPHARAILADACARFVHMYRPHESREDTVLFPKLRGIISAHEFAAWSSNGKSSVDLVQMAFNGPLQPSQGSRSVWASTIWRSLHRSRGTGGIDTAWRITENGGSKTAGSVQ